MSSASLKKETAQGVPAWRRLRLSLQEAHPACIRCISGVGSTKLGACVWGIALLLLAFESRLVRAPGVRHQLRRAFARHTIAGMPDASRRNINHLVSDRRDHFRCAGFFPAASRSRRTRSTRVDCSGCRLKVERRKRERYVAGRHSDDVLTNYRRLVTEIDSSHLVMPQSRENSNLREIGKHYRGWFPFWKAAVRRIAIGSCERDCLIQKTTNIFGLKIYSAS